MFKFTQSSSTRIVKRSRATRAARLREQRSARIVRQSRATSTRELAAPSLGSDSYSDFLLALERVSHTGPRHSLRLTEQRQARERLYETRPRLKPFPRSHAEFVEAIHEPSPNIVGGKLNLNRLGDRDGMPVASGLTGQERDPPRPHGGQLCEICKFLDDGNLNDAQKVESVKAYVARSDDPQLDPIRKILVMRINAAQKVARLADSVAHERVDVEESFVRELKRPAPYRFQHPRQLR